MLEHFRPGLADPRQTHREGVDDAVGIAEGQGRDMSHWLKIDRYCW
jgi:hypothetical protein